MQQPFGQTQQPYPGGGGLAPPQDAGFFDGLDSGAWTIVFIALGFV